MFLYVVGCKIFDCKIFSYTGHETTNNLLGYASYLLALHPEEQDKLYKEITDFYSNKPVSYCSVLIFYMYHTFIYDANRLYFWYFSFP